MIPMPATLTDTQLKSALTNEQIVKARTKGLADGDTVDPVAEEISAAVAKVDTYCAGYAVSAGLLTGWARDIAAHQVAKRLEKPTEDQVRAYETALSELKDVRDGKFPNLPKVAGATSGKVASGGKTKIT